MSIADERASIKPRRRPIGLRLWHLSVVVLAVAIAGGLVREGKMREPTLIAIAGAGFLAWCLVTGLGFRLVLRELRRPVGGTPWRKVAAVLLYLLAMSASFVVGLF